jgi:hypothetical protein
MNKKILHNFTLFNNRSISNVQTFNEISNNVIKHKQHNVIKQYNVIKHKQKQKQKQHNVIQQKQHNVIQHKQHNVIQHNTVIQLEQKSNNIIQHNTVIQLEQKPNNIITNYDFNINSVGNWKNILDNLTLNKISNLQNHNTFDIIINEKNIQLFINKLIEQYIII